MSDELMEIVVKSPTFTEDHPIPAKYTGDGTDTSPPLTWSGVPHGTRSLVLLCEDPDAPRGTWSHWVLFNLPPEAREVSAGATGPALPSGAVEGTNDFGRPGYGGPSPPPGQPPPYHFQPTAL